MERSKAKTSDLFRGTTRKTAKHPLDAIAVNKAKEQEKVYEEEPPENVRQTFLLNRATLERIKDIVYFQKIQGNIYYTQQEVIEEAIDALLEQIGEVPERPEEEKEREKMRNAKRRTRKK
ncbi:hypothetical protein [Flexithrix dorotheae]|uniref:hypothetical protein n=1 Tax=Flexithrix dorotheae TaxID=70993 RepID=UPI00035DC7A5|nr:hypothetical protein [Flexithrix dorotheae]